MAVVSKNDIPFSVCPLWKYIKGMSLNIFQPYSAGGGQVELQAQAGGGRGRERT